LNKTSTLEPSGSAIQSLWRTRELISVVLVGEGLAVVLSLTPGATDDRWVYFGLSSFMIQWTALLSLGVLFLLRNRINTLNINNLLYSVLAILLACTWVIGTAAWWLQASSFGANSSLLAFLGKISAIALVVGTLSCAAFQNHWQAQRMAVKAKQAELEALTARIRPHFLFNTLNAGASLVRVSPEKAEQLLLNLADLFRAALSDKQEISLNDELELTKRYVEIESLRFVNRVNIHWDLPSPLPSIMIPSLSIQPLVENAIRHGVEPTLEKVNLEIIVREELKKVTITISNDIPKTKNQIPLAGHNMGLASSRERIRALSHGHAELTTRIENNRFIAEINLPTTSQR
jgi:two-component system, LytTR family, sensor histidine kinase AlgZ